MKEFHQPSGKTRAVVIATIGHIFVIGNPEKRLVESNTTAKISQLLKKKRTRKRKRKKKKKHFAFLLATYTLHIHKLHRTLTFSSVSLHTRHQFFVLFLFFVFAFVLCFFVCVCVFFFFVVVVVLFPVSYSLRGQNHLFSHIDLKSTWKVLYLSNFIEDF